MGTMKNVDFVTPAQARREVPSLPPTIGKTMQATTGNMLALLSFLSRTAWHTCNSTTTSKPSKPRNSRCWLRGKVFMFGLQQLLTWSMSIQTRYGKSGKSDFLGKAISQAVQLRILISTLRKRLGTRKMQELIAATHRGGSNQSIQGEAT